MDNGAQMEQTIEIKKVIAGGLGLGHGADGKAVMVPGVLPDETVTVTTTREHRGYVEAELVRVETPSPDRISPPCPHHGTCADHHVVGYHDPRQHHRAGADQHALSDAHRTAERRVRRHMAERATLHVMIDDGAMIHDHAHFQQRTRTHNGASRHKTAAADGG